MTKICPKCGTGNPDTGGFCQNCGEDLKNESSSSKSNKTSNNKTTSWWSRQNKGTKTIIGITGVCCLGLILLVVIGGMISPDNTTNNISTSVNTSSKTTTVDSSTFENQFISFKKPTDLTIKDNSNTTKLDVLFYQGETLMGEINSATTTTANINAMLSDGSNTTIAGKTATEYSDSASVGAYIFLEKNNNGEKMVMFIDFDPSYSSDYTLIKDSLTIKQNPSQ